MKKLAFLALASMTMFVVMPMALHAQSSGPTTPASISASVLQSGQVYVSWSESTSQATINGYYLYRDSRLIANTPGLPYYTDNAPAGTHTYTVSAYDTNGSFSPQSLPTSPITLTQDTPPTAPTGLTLVPSSSSVALSWNAASDDIAVIGYYIYRNGQQLILPNTIAGTSYTDTGLAIGYTYTYMVGAYNAQGYITRTAPMSVTTIFDVTQPSVPQNLKAKGVSTGEIDLSWSPSTDNISLVGYAIYRNGQFVGNGNGTSTAYQDTGLSQTTSYSYTVMAIDEVGNMSGQSIPAAAMTTAPDTTPPSIPSGLSYRSPSTSEIDLSWNPSTDNVSVSSYAVSRDGTQLGTVVSPIFIDTGLATGTTYQYFVSASDASGNVSPAQSIAAKTLTTNPVVPVVSPIATTTQSWCPPFAMCVTPPASSTITTPVIPPSGSYVFSTLIYFGMRGAAVSNLQTVLIAQGNLAPQYATGYFGSLTQKAVQQFQCAHAIVCSGSPFVNGYGLVGARTRAALNSL